MMLMEWRRVVASILLVFVFGVVGLGVMPTMAADDAGQASAEVGHGHVDPPGTPPLLQFDAGSAIVNIAIFIAVLVILSKLVWPVILNGLEMRDSKIRSDLEGAHFANLEAKQLLVNYEAKLAEASSEVQKMLAEAQRASESERQRIVADARTESETHRLRAIADIEQAKKVAISELAGQTSDMAMAVARKIVSRELRADDHVDLIRQSLERLPSNN